MISRSIFFYVFFFITQVIYSQKLYYSFDHVTLEDGLASNSIICIHQDKKGFIWMSSTKGLDKYDGYKVRNYKKIKNDSLGKYGLISNDIVSITSDNDDNMWLASKLGLTCLNLITEQVSHYFTKIDASNNYTESSITNLIYDSTSNSVWGGYEGNIFRFNTKTKNITVYKYDSTKANGIPKGGLMKIIKDRKDNLWFTFWDCGISLYNRKSDNFKHYIHNNKDKESIFSYPVFGIAADNECNIWVSSLMTASVCKLNIQTQKFEHFTEKKYKNLSPFWGIGVDKTGKIWFSSGNIGLGIFNPKTQLFTQINHESNNPESLSESRASISAMLDNNNNMWIASMNKGVNKTDLKLSSVNYFPIDNNLLNKPSFVNSILEINNNLWVSNEDGVFVFDLATHNYKKIKIPNPTEVIGKLVNLFDGNILAIGSKNNYIINSNTQQSKIYKGDFLENKAIVSGTYKDANGKIWIITSTNVYVFKSNIFNKPFRDFKTSKIIASERFCYVNYSEKNNILSISIENELFVFSLNNYSLRSKSATNKGFSSPNRVTSLYQSSDSLYLYDVQGWRSCDINFNFSNHKNYPFLFADEVVPISHKYNDSMACITTYRGIFIYNFRTQKYIHPRVFNADKINPDVFVKANDGKTFYLSAGTGIVSFVPSELEKTSYIPEIVLSDFQLFNQSVIVNSENSPLKESITYTKNITLNYNQDMFSIEMSILNYDEVQRNQFMYKMEGFDADWNNIGNRRIASFTNLSPGKYVFRYKGKDKNNNETSEKFVNITILPPYWATWWFRILVFCIVALILYTIYKVRINNIKQQKIELEHQVIIRTAEILSQKQEIMSQKEDIEEHEKRITELYEDIKDSITTAQRIQESILPPENLIQQCLPESYVLYLPKDIVSGDFYWFHVDVDRFYIAAVDCTGHGVAGAFMSLIAHNLLNRIIKDERNLTPKQVLDRLNSYVIQVLHQESEHPISKDGMDVSICMILPKTNEIHVSGANNGIYYVRNGNLEQIRANKNSVGVQPMGRMANFENFVMTYLPGDKFYMFSDGFAGQFGGLNGNEKMKYNRFRENIIQNSVFPMKQQKEALHTMLKDFQKTTEQTDDILVIGFEL